jgi:fumarate hydratase subunit beta
MSERPMKKIVSPLSDSIRLSLRAGDMVSITGVLYTGRDAAHQLMVQSLTTGETLPFNLNGQSIYYVGPTPSRPGHVIGSCGPTSSYRMDPYSPTLMEHGLKVMIGKGPRSDAFKQSLLFHRAIYLDVTGGIGALLAKCVSQMELVAYPWLESEAVYRLTVTDFPAVVAYDSVGNDLFEYQK